MSKNTLIISRPGVGKTQKAIEYYIDKVSSNHQGVYLSLEMEEPILMSRILKTCESIGVSLSQVRQKNLYVIDSLKNIDQIIDYINEINETIHFLIIDYLQLLSYEDTNEFNAQMDLLFYFCKEKDIDVIVLSQLKMGAENKDAVWTEMVLELVTPSNFFLKYIDEGILLTKVHGEIYCDDVAKVSEMSIK